MITKNIVRMIYTQSLSASSFRPFKGKTTIKSICSHNQILLGKNGTSFIFSNIVLCFLIFPYPLLLYSICRPQWHGLLLCSSFLQLLQQYFSCLYLLICCILHASLKPPMSWNKFVQARNVKLLMRNLMRSGFLLMVLGRCSS